MKAGAPPHLFDQFSLNTLTIHIKSLCHQYFWQCFPLCQKLSHFSTRHFHDFFHQKNKKSNNFFVKTMGSTAVLCGLLHTFDGKSLKVMKTKRKLVLWKILPGLFSRIFSMFLFWKADWWSLRARQYSNSVSARDIKTRNYRWHYLLVYHNRA